MAVQLPTGIERRLMQRRLARCTATLQELREDLRVTNEQFDVMRDEANDAELRAIVSETPSTQATHRDTQQHFLAISKHRSFLTDSIAECEAELDSLLDRLNAREA